MASAFAALFRIAVKISRAFRLSSPELNEVPLPLKHSTTLSAIKRN